MAATQSAPGGITLLNQTQAVEVDEILMSPEGGFSIFQLMELAGLSVACAIAKEYAPILAQNPRILILAGPGNNGGDGLVAARHLKQFGFEPSVVYPKAGKHEIFGGLVRQLETLDLTITPDVPSTIEIEQTFAVVVDAVFGFSFRGWRGSGKDAPFDAAVERMSEVKLPVVSIDIPSGWHVEDGPAQAPVIQPEMLISLTAPKLCARHFTGAHHYLGGRFVTPALAARFGLELPRYPGVEQCVKINI